MVGHCGANIWSHESHGRLSAGATRSDACFSAGINDSSAPASVFRDPFVLKVKVDKRHNYEEHFEKIPSVAENDVYLFAGESFGINLQIKEDDISGITYQPDLAKADVQFRFC